MDSLFRMLACWMCTCAALVVSAQTPRPQTYLQKTRTFHSADEFARLTADAFGSSGSSTPSGRQRSVERSLRCRAPS